MLALLILADPLDYMGLVPGRWFEYTGFYSDSTAGDPKREFLLFNRTEVGSEFSYQGHRAVVITSTDSLWDTTGSYSDTIMSKADTAYSDTPWVRLITDIGIDTALDLAAYKVPLSVGDRWPTGAEGVYQMDVDNDGQIDTVWVLGDTTQVETLETVEVPAGTYQAYKLADSTVAFFKLYTGDSGTLNITRIQWWTPWLGMVRDSVELVASAYYGAYLIPAIFQWRVHELAAVEVKESQGGFPEIKVILGQKGLFVVAKKPRRVAVYSPDGRLLRALKVQGRAWIPLKSGVYLLKIGDRVFKAVVG